MSALKQPTIRVVAIIAEGVPESDAKQLISYARANNKVKTKLNKLFFHTI
jgi:ATP citrate (pro-S)-lyase